MVLFKVQYVGRVPLMHDDAAPFNSDDCVDAIKFLRRSVAWPVTAPAGTWQRFDRNFI